jgi:hypothetical protein
MCPYLSTGVDQPYTDPNGVTCYPSQLDAFGYCPGSLTSSGGGGTVTDGGGSGGGGSSTSPQPPVGPQPMYIPGPTLAPDYGSGSSGDGSQYASSQVPAPGMLVPVAAASALSWAGLSPTMKIAVVLLGLGVVGGGYYMLKRRRRVAA